MPLKPMKPNRKAVLDAIAIAIKSTGRAPTIREIAEAAKISPASVMKHLDMLSAWGYIEREERVRRGIRLGQQYNPR